MLHYSRENVEPNTLKTTSVKILEQYWQRPDGQVATREHLLMALAGLSSILIKATYTTGTKEVAYVYIADDNITVVKIVAAIKCVMVITITGYSRFHSILPICTTLARTELSK